MGVPFRPRTPAPEGFKQGYRILRVPEVQRCRGEAGKGREKKKKKGEGRFKGLFFISI